MPRALARRLVVSSLLAASPAFAGEFLYEIDDPPVTSVRKLDDARLASILPAELKKRNLTVKNGATGATDVDGLPREVKQALLMTVSMKPGSEQDLMVENAGKYTPVQVTWDDGVVTFTAGPQRDAIYGKGPDKAELQKKYGVGEFVDDGAAWDADLLYSVDVALSKLTRDELALIAGLSFHRMPKEPTGRSGRMLAIFRQDSTLPKPRFEVYDASKEVDRVRFCGDPANPVPQSAAMVVHEVAHALSRATASGTLDAVKEARKALDDAAAAFNEGQKQYNADRETYAKTKDPELKKSLQERAAKTKEEMAKVQALQKTWQDLQNAAKQGMGGSATETAFLQKLPLNKAPTPYARTLGSEAFAESYRLWKLDKPALERAAPGISAWFESAAFTDTLKKK